MTVAPKQEFNQQTNNAIQIGGQFLKAAIDVVVVLTEPLVAKGFIDGVSNGFEGTESNVEASGA